LGSEEEYLMQIVRFLQADFTNTTQKVVTEQSQITITSTALERLTPSMRYLFTASKSLQFIGVNQSIEISIMKAK
jgi:hypothetical protein